MIAVKLSGRLGNQMFQYAYARYLKEKTKQEIVIDDRYVYLAGSIDQGWENSLKYFNTKFSVSNAPLFRCKMNIIQKALALLDNEFQKIYNGNIIQLNNYELRRTKLFSRFGLFFLWQGYYDFDYKNKKNLFLQGNYESVMYFDEIRDILIDEFKPVLPPIPENENLYNQILQSESVCISIRRGDFYYSDNVFGDLFHVCNENYYLKAVEKMVELVPHCKFFVFSDDIDWCKQHLKFPNGSEFESGQDPVYEKLRLMYSCKHFIISNSTFSWWAQYLGTNKNKIVISPKKWFNSEFESKLINEKDWILIDNE